MNEGEIYFDGSKESVIAQPKLMHENNLEIPRIIKFAQHLHEKGIISRLNFYSVTDLKKYLYLKNIDQGLDRGV